MTLQEYMQEYTAITTNTDLLNFIILHILSDKEKVWYNDLLDNRKHLRSQWQIGVLHRKAQPYVCKCLTNVNKRIRNYLVIFEDKVNYTYFLEVLTKRTTLRQQEYLYYYIRFRSINEVAQALHTTKATVQGMLRLIIKRLKRREPTFSRFLKLAHDMNLFTFYNEDMF